MAKIKYLLYFILSILLLFLVFNYSAIIYGLQQGKGQAQLLWNSVEIERLKNDPNTSDSLLEKFALIEQIRKFAADSLGLSIKDNYTTFYDQKGKPILWTVTASPEFEIKPYQWHFPIAGSFPYKGFFDLEKAKAEEKLLQSQSYDTRINEVSAWSTLGWFKDPILSSMLERSTGKLAELIIHEATHSTIYLKDSIEFNENLASFIGRKGAEQFLQYYFKYKEFNEELISYQKQLKRSQLFRNIMRKSIRHLSEKYKTMEREIPISEKKALKQQWIDEMKADLQKSGYYENDSIAEIQIKKFHPNNAYFSGFSTYSNQSEDMDYLLNKKFNGNLRMMISSFKSKGLSL